MRDMALRQGLARQQDGNPDKPYEAESRGPPSVAEVVSRVPQAVSNPSPLMMLDRLVRDTSISPERMSAALPIVMELVREDRRAAFEAAYPAMSADLPIVEKRGKFEYKGGKPITYSRFEDIVELVRPILRAHKFGIRWRLAQDDKGVTATCILSHEGGYATETPFWVAYDTRSVNAAQAAGSARSYAMRYSLTAALGIVSRDMDDDGVAAGGGTEYVNEAELEDLKGMFVGLESGDIAQFCRAFSIDGLEFLPARRLKEAKARITARTAALKRKRETSGTENA